MPDIFKALATIMAWILWIVALLMGFSTFGFGIVVGDIYGATVPSMEYAALFAVSAFYALAAIVIMILRKKME